LPNNVANLLINGSDVIVVSCDLATDGGGVGQVRGEGAGGFPVPLAPASSLKGFTIAGEDKTFVWTDATIDGDCVVVSSPQVSHPVAVRYGWANNPEVNLYNREGLPAVPFRTDGWVRETARKP
jgi:sialate O-acetylesterase